MPLFLFTAGYFWVQTWRRMAQYTLTVHEVRLKSDGMHIEISFLNWFGQVWEHNRYTMHIADLMPPPLYSDSQPLLGDHFPVSPEIFEIQSSSREPWVKFFDAVRRRHFIPKDYDFMDRELMVAVMSGFYIDTSNT